MPGPRLLASPRDWLSALATRLHTTPERVPSPRATEELIAWLEAMASAGVTIPAPYLQVAARLVYEQARLALPPSRDDVWALAERLRRENRGRPQAAQWEDRDWVKLARLVLANRRIRTAALFGENPPSAEQIIREVEIPFAARYVEEPLEEDARQLRAPTWSALLERAEELLNLVADEVEEARTMLADLRATAPLLRRPPSRSNSANPSQELCESRSNSAK